MAIRLEVIVRAYQVAPGTGPVLMAQNISDIPGIGQTNQPGPGQNGQTLYLSDAEMVPGTAGSYTVANFNTALAAAVTALAGASGAPKITAAILAQMKAWNTGSP